MPRPCSTALASPTFGAPVTGVNGGDAAIYGRMQYVPNLKGDVIAQAYDKNVYFVRTG